MCLLFFLSNQTFVFQSSPLFLPVSHWFRGWSKISLKLYDFINCLSKNYDTINYSSFIHFFFWIWKVWVGISQERRALRKTFFIVFEGLSFGEIIKLWYKWQAQTLKRLYLWIDISFLIIVLKKHWLLFKFFQCYGKILCQETKNWPIFHAFSIQISKQADGFSSLYQEIF